jgi:Homeodomain-like domain
VQTPTLGALGGVIGRSRKEAPADAALHIQFFAADGFSIVGIAEKFGVSRNTLDRWIADSPDLREALDRGREKERHTLHNRLYRIAVESDDEKAASIAAMFLLKARHGYKEGDPGEQANRVSVTFNLPGALTREQFAEARNATPVIEISGTSTSDTRSA